MINEYSTKLSNGLTLVCNPMDNTGQMNITFVFKNVGRGTDPKEKEGISHLAEHMVFRGTDTMSAKDIASKLNYLTGNCYTAYTAYGETVFSLDIDHKNFRDAVSLLVDMFTKSTCPDFEIEKKVVGHELDLRFDNPLINLFDLTEAKSYGLTNNDKVQKSVLSSITQKDVSDFIKSNYVPNNCTLYISGKISEKQRTFESIVEDYVEDWKGNSKQNDLPKVQYKNGLSLENALTKSAYCSLVFEGAKSSDIKGFVAQCIVNAISGSGLNSIPMLDARLVQGLTYGIHGFNLIEPNHGLWGLTSSTDKSSVKELMKSMMTSVKAILPSISNDNVACARIALKNELNKPIFTPGSTTANAIFFNSLGVSKEVFIEIIDNTSTEEVKAFYNKAISSKPCITLYGDIDKYTEAEFSTMWDGISVAT